jgi:hypothetical protein
LTNIRFFLFYNIEHAGHQVVNHTRSITYERAKCVSDIVIYHDKSIAKETGISNDFFFCVHYYWHREKNVCLFSVLKPAQEGHTWSKFT